MLNYAKTQTVYSKLWQEAGFDLLLLSDPARKDVLKFSKAKVKPKQIIQNIPQIPKDTQFEFRKENLYNQALEKVAKQEEKLISSPRTSEEARDQEAQNVPLYKNILNDFEWPQDWENMWQKIMKHQNPKVAWTYTGLHADMFDGAGKNQERQALIGKFIKELARPHGTHVFIPYDKAHESGSLFTFDDKSFFWSAIARVKVQHILVFGSQARDELQLGRRGVHSVFQHGRYRIYLLNDINILLDGKSDGRDVLAYVNRQLSAVNL